MADVMHWVGAGLFWMLISSISFVLFAKGYDLIRRCNHYIEYNCDGDW